MLDVIIFTIKVLYWYINADFPEVTEEVEVTEEAIDNQKIEDNLPKQGFEVPVIEYSPLESNFKISDYLPVSDDESSDSETYLETELTYDQLLQQLTLEGTLDETNPNYQDYLEYLDYVKAIEIENLQSKTETNVSQDNPKLQYTLEPQKGRLKSYSDKVNFIENIKYEAYLDVLQNRISFDPEPAYINSSNKQITIK